MTVAQLDVRRVPKSGRHALIFDRFAALNDGASFVLVNSHDPEAPARGVRTRPRRGLWLDESRDRTNELASPHHQTRLQRRAPHACHAYALVSDNTPRDSAGAVWRLEARQQHLDANIIRLPPNNRIESHVGPERNGLLFVTAGDGKLTTSIRSVTLLPGDVTWLPRRPQRSFLAGPFGLSYLTRAPRRPGLWIDSPATRKRGRPYPPNSY
jgi:quercetin dioxygenase-like cupin family protein